MLKLGLTGKICAGKTQVEKILEDKGYKVIDLDIVAHMLLENNKEIEKHFKTLDRKKIAKAVFSNYDEKCYLESVLHPLIYDYILDEFKKDYNKIVISGALLYEAGFDKLFDKIIYVDTPYEIRLMRLMRRNKLSESEAKIRLDSQKEDNKKRADFIIENSGSIDDLKKAINSIL